MGCHLGIGSGTLPIYQCDRFGCSVGLPCSTEQLLSCRSTLHVVSLEGNRETHPQTISTLSFVARGDPASVVNVLRRSEKMGERAEDYRLLQRSKESINTGEFATGTGTYRLLVIVGPPLTPTLTLSVKGPLAKCRP